MGLKKAALTGLLASLVFTSGAYSASQYSITSVGQIKPSVVRALRAPPRVYSVASRALTLDASHPSAVVDAVCRGGDRVLGGGFGGAREIVTLSSEGVTSGYPARHAWVVDARLDSGAPTGGASPGRGGGSAGDTGQVSAWALCEAR